MTHKDFGRTVLVVLPDKTRISVPIDEQAALEQCKVVAARTKEFFEVQMKKMKVAKLTPKEILDLVTAADRLDNLLRTQYAASLSALLGRSNPSSAGFVAGMGKVGAQAAEGAARGITDSFLNKMREMEKASKKAEPVPIEVEGAPKK